MERIIDALRRWYERKMLDIVNGKHSRIPVVDRATYNLGWKDGYTKGSRDGFREGFDVCLQSTKRND